MSNGETTDVNLETYHTAIIAALAIGVVSALFTVATQGSGTSGLVVTTPYENSNFSTDIGTPVRVDFYINNPTGSNVSFDVDESNLDFSTNWSFWSRPNYDTREKVSLVAEENKSELVIPVNESRFVSAKFVTPLKEGVYDVELKGETNHGDFSKKVTVVAENGTEIE